MLLTQLLLVVVLFLLLLVLCSTITLRQDGAKGNAMRLVIRPKITCANFQQLFIQSQIASVRAQAFGACAQNFEDLNSIRIHASGVRDRIEERAFA